MKHKFSFSPVLLLIYSWALLTIRLGAPWFGHHDANAVWISSAIRNFQLYGAAQLRWLAVVNPGPATPETFLYYTHHPPLTYWLSALSTIPFGFHEISIRFLFACATLISVAAFYTLNRRLVNTTHAWWATLIYTSVPMVAYFGRMPDHEALSLAVSMTFAALLVNWLRRPNRKQYWTLVTLAWVAVWTAWASSLYISLLGLMAFLCGNAAQRRMLLILGALALLALIALLGFHELMRPGALQDQLDVLLWRTSDSSLLTESTTFTAIEWGTRQFGHIVTLATPGILILAVGGVVALLRFGPRRARVMLITLYGVGLGYILLLRNAAFIHDYYKIYLIPPLAMSAAAAVQYGWRSRRYYMRPVIVGMLVLAFLSGAYMLVFLHQSNRAEFPRFLIQVFNERTVPDDQIQTNLPYTGDRFAVQFYTYRNVQWGVPVTQAVEEVMPIVYLYCDEGTVPPELAGLNYELVGDCLLIRLNKD